MHTEAQLNEIAMSCGLSYGEVVQETEALDAFEDALLRALTEAAAQTYLVAVTTGNGTRDLYFTAVDRAELPVALKSIEGERPFSVTLSTGDPAAFLDALTLSKEEL